MGVSRMNGIVLRYANYRDNDRILSLYTRENGLISATSRGCRRPKSPLLGASELFVYGEFVLFENKGRYTVNEASVQESFYPLREDVSRFAAGMSMLNLTEKGGTDQKNEALFDTLYYCLSYLAYGEGEAGDMTLCFLLHALDVLGFRPSLTRCCICGEDLRAKRKIAFSPQQGGACCVEHAPDREVKPLSMEAARRILCLDKRDFQKVILPETVRQELLSQVAVYAECVLECSLKSIKQI